MRVGSLFSGIGGFEIAAEHCGHEVIWQSEVDPYASAVLKHHWPNVPNLGDITKIDWRSVERPDIICGGFPCQDISYAGKGAGLQGERSGLWFEFARAIHEVGPRYVVVENVRALLTRGFDAVLGTLADLGYDAEWAMYGAEDVGAPHRRHRVWIIAYSLQRWGAIRNTGGGGFLGEPRRPDGQEFANRRLALSGPGGEAMADPQRERLEREQQAGPAAGPTDRPSNGCDSGWWATEPNVGRVAHGVPSRAHRLRGLGNAIVPACAVPIFRRIEEIERSL